MQQTPKPKQDPRPALEVRAFVSLMRAADALSRSSEALLKPYNLSGTQYNVLRILRGAGQEGLACSEIRRRLISRDPDITRLLDRMESRGWIGRARETQDRRVVKTRITEKGLRLLAELDPPVSASQSSLWRRFPSRQLVQLSLLLDRAFEQAQGAQPGE